MYRNAYQRGMLTILFSGGCKPLNIWETHIQDGYITRFLDPDIKSMVLEIGGTNVSTTYMVCPKGTTVLGITMPFLVMIVKNLKKYFTFEVTILDETNTRRRFRVSNFQSTTQILPLCTVMPIGLSDGWNQIQFNLAEFTRRAYKKQFVEVQKLKINANIRVRRIYFAERLLPEDQLPAEYKLYFPLPTKSRMKKGQEVKDKENIPDAVPPEVTAKVEEVKPVEKPSSKTEVVHVGSKASVHSAKQPSQAKIEEGAPAEGGEEGAPKEGAAPEGETEGGVAEAPEGEESAPAGEEAAPEGEAAAPEGEAPAEGAEEAPAPASEEPAPTAEEAPPEPAPAEEVVPEAPPAE